MVVAARIVFGVLGLLVAIYAAETLAETVTPPWWLRRDLTARELEWERAGDDYGVDIVDPFAASAMARHLQVLGAVLSALGLGLVALAAWPRRPGPDVPAAA